MSGGSERGIYQTVVSLAREGQFFALATVLDSEGPAPGRSGARAIVLGGEVIQGTVGGGIVEAETVRRAVACLAQGQPILFDHSLAGDDAAGDVPVCGGRMSILVDPQAVEYVDAYGAAAAALQQRRRGILVTEIQSTASETTLRTAYLDHRTASAAGREKRAEVIRAALDRQLPELVTIETGPAGSTRMFLQPVIPPPCLLVFGGGHVGRAVANLAAQAGFEVVVVDDRLEYLDPGRFAERVVTRCGSIPDEVQRFSFAQDTFVVIVTRNHQLDAVALEACLKHDVAYIGMMGSRGKVAAVKRQFVRSDKATIEQLDKLYAPIGLDIGAVTVSEIATSIVAQLICVRRRGAAPRK